MGLMGDSNYWSQYYDGSGVGWRPGPTRRLAASQIQGESQLLSISTAKWWHVYLVNWWTLHQGRWPVCDRCGGENQTARFGDCQFASLLKVPIFLPHPGSPPTAGLVWGRWQRRRRKSASRSSKSLQGGHNRFLFFCMGISGTSLLRKCFSIIFLFCRHQIAKSSGVKESLDRRIVIISNGFTFI